MKETVNYSFDSEDIELLKKPIPNDPCNKCSDRVGCCGCNEHDIYREAIKPYKDRNIFEIANKLRTRNKIKQSIEESYSKISDINKELEKYNLPSEFYDDNK